MAAASADAAAAVAQPIGGNAAGTKEALDGSQPAAGPPVTLQHRHVFGINCEVKSNVHYAEEAQLIYPAGTNTVLWLADQKQQKFFQGNPGAGGITCLAVNSSKRYLAVAEKSFPAAIVTVFDLVTTKKRKTLSQLDCDAPEFVSVSFSSDNKFLLTQTGRSTGGDHDFTLMYWMWDKARLMASVKVANGQGPLVRECSFNPSDATMVAVVGDCVLKFYQMRENLTPIHVQDAPNSVNILCHVWLGEDKMMACSESGDLILFDIGSELACVSPRLPSSPGEHRSLACVLAFSKGFIAGGDDGLLRVYERSDDPKERYRKTKSIQVDGGSNVGVRGIALSPSEEVLAVSTSTAQLYQLSLLGQDLLKPEEAPVFEPVLTPFHSGPILGMDICTRKPLVVTCGVDKSVRVWNYQEKTCELCKIFNEEAFSVAFHPSGFHLIIGFSDKLRLMNVLMEDLRTYRDVPIKACRECCFSNGGQYFAAVSAAQINVYKTYTCESIANLRGHNNKVRSVAWTADDSMLVSTGMDGAVYEYNVLAEGRRVGYDFVLKGTSFSCVIVYTDPSTGGNTMYVVGTDKMLREVYGGQAHNILQAGTTLGQIVLSNSAKCLFAIAAETDAPAAVRCYKFPLDGNYVEYPAHSLPATRIRLTYDDYYLFTCSEDGCLFIFDVRRKDRLNSKRDKENALLPADEILVTRTFLDEKHVQLVELERQVEELSNQIEFQLRHRESYHKEEMVELEEKYTQEIDQERHKYENLREEKNDMEMEYEESIKNLTELHAKQTQDLESSFQHKMMAEVGRYSKLKAELDRYHTKWEADHKQLMEKHQRILTEMQRGFNEKQAQDKHRIQLIMEEKDLAERVHQETMRQLEQDTDREIEELKEEKEARLKAEKDDKVRLRGQSGIHKRNHEELKRQMQKKEEELRQYEDSASRKQERIDNLQKEQDNRRQEIKERDRMIGDKEQKIYDLKKQNQELEKFKFVLDYKIKELKAQIDPKNDKIAEMKKTIHRLDSDLEEYHKKNKKLQVSIEQLVVLQSALQEEIVSQKKKKIDCQTIIKRFRTDLHECVQFIQDPRMLKESAQGMYKKYVPHGIKKQELDPDIQREYTRQRTYLEKSVDSLKRKLLKDSGVHRQDNMRILQENVALIREINDLRQEIDYLKRERQQQRLNVNKMASAQKEKEKTGASDKEKKDEKPLSEETARELEANKQTIGDLRRRIAEQAQLREMYMATQRNSVSPSDGFGERAFAQQGSPV